MTYPPEILDQARERIRLAMRVSLDSEPWPQYINPGPQLSALVDPQTAQALYDEIVRGYEAKWGRTIPRYDNRQPAA